MQRESKSTFVEKATQSKQLPVSGAKNDRDKGQAHSHDDKPNKNMLPIKLCEELDIDNLNIEDLVYI